MKKLLLCSVVLLSGCSLVDAYFMAKYDTTEHALINRIGVHAAIYKDDCADHDKTKTNAAQLLVVAKELKNFSEHLPNNELTIKLVVPIHTMVEDLNKRYTEKEVSKTYCELKLQSISNSADYVQKAIAKRPRT